MQLLVLLMCLKFMLKYLPEEIPMPLTRLRKPQKHISNREYMTFLFLFVLCKKIIESDILITLETLRLRILVLVTNTPPS